MIKKLLIFAIGGAFLFASCGTDQKTEKREKESPMKAKVDQYAVFDLKTDISHLSDNQKEMLKILFKVSDVMEELFWQDACGNKEELMAKIDDPYMKTFAEINYGPWDRLKGDKPFVEGYGMKPPGANYYPKDITKEEFEKGFS